MSGRDRTLARVRSALARRDRTELPESFGEWRLKSPPVSPIEGFQALFESAGGEVVRVSDRTGAAAWIARFSADFPSVIAGELVPADLKPDLPSVSPDAAALGLSMARGAVAETGSLVMDARDGRRAQLLAPTHVVVLDATAVYASLREALISLRDDLPSAIGFHSGPSKSADIGQIMVRGVHGPGRVIALVIGESAIVQDHQQGIS